MMLSMYSNGSPDKREERTNGMTQNSSVYDPAMEGDGVSVIGVGTSTSPTRPEIAATPTHSEQQKDPNPLEPSSLARSFQGSPNYYGTIETPNDRINYQANPASSKSPYDDSNTMVR